MTAFTAFGGTTYTPTLLVSYGGPWAENFFYATEDPHGDPKLARFTPHEELLADYPQLTEEDLRACLGYGALLASGRFIDVA